MILSMETKIDLKSTEVLSQIFQSLCSSCVAVLYVHRVSAALSNSTIHNFIITSTFKILPPLHHVVLSSLWS